MQPYVLLLPRHCVDLSPPPLCRSRWQFHPKQDPLHTNLPIRGSASCPIFDHRKAYAVAEEAPAPPASTKSRNSTPHHLKSNNRPNKPVLQVWTYLRFDIFGTYQRKCQQLRSSPFSKRRNSTSKTTGLNRLSARKNSKATRNL